MSGSERPETPRPDPALGGLAGVLIYTEAERHAAMAAFYADVLGLPVRTRRPGFVSFAWGDLRLTITVHSQVAGPTTEADRIMLNLAVADIGASHAALRSLGVAFSRPPSQEPWGGWIATFADPDGNTVQLLQGLPEPRPEAAPGA